MSRLLLAACAIFISVLTLGLGSTASAKNDLTSFRHLRNVEADDNGPEDATGVPFPPMSGVRLVPDTPYLGMATVLIPASGDDLVSMIPIEVPDSINLAFAGGQDGTYRLLLLDHPSGVLSEVRVQNPLVHH